MHGDTAVLAAAMAAGCGRRGDRACGEGALYRGHRVGSVWVSGSGSMVILTAETFLVTRMLIREYNKGGQASKQ